MPSFLLDLNVSAGAPAPLETKAFLGMGSTEKQQAGMESKKNQVLTTSVKPCNSTSCPTDWLLFA